MVQDYFLDICTYLTVDNSVVVRVVTVCDMFNFPHIKIEGSRLLASLIKNHHDKGECSL